MTFKLIKQIVALIAFSAITYFKVTGGDVEAIWIIVPAVIMGIDPDHIKAAKELIKK